MKSLLFKEFVSWISVTLSLFSALSLCSYGVFSVKVTLGGDPRTGKSSFLYNVIFGRNLCEDCYSDAGRTVGVEQADIQVQCGEREICLNIYDTAGGTRFEPDRERHMTDSKVFIVFTGLSRQI
ncbi:MAG: hypothetical protein LBK29_04520 [Oscillospiraceae bacterium]|jgi:GTPase SAR1 family protein|nr:hypothetical protein [Oscillospiraceae bacterium]